MRKPYQLPGWIKTHPTIVPRSGIELTTSRLHNFIMAKVSHALNHSAMEKPVCVCSLAHCRMRTERKTESRSQGSGAEDPQRGVGGLRVGGSGAGGREPGVGSQRSRVGWGSEPGAGSRVS